MIKEEIRSRVIDAWKALNASQCIYGSDSEITACCITKWVTLDELWRVLFDEEYI